MENVIKNNDLQNVKFDINSEFFVIDANNLEKVSSKLYGFCLDNSHIVLDIKDLHKDFGNEGAYVYVKNDDNIITVKQDFVGCYGIYIFRQDDYFATSNSFMYLVDYLKKNYKLTFNKDYANAFLSSNLETFSCQETIINEIVVLERNAIIKINKAKRSMEIIHKNYQENSLEPDSKEFFASLDMWYFKWTKFIRNLKKKTNNVMVDLTGGFDSRITFLLFLGANINLDEIFINSINDNLYTHKKDYEIASKIANHYNFKLNQGNKFITSKSYYKKQDCNLKTNNVNNMTYFDFLKTQEGNLVDINKIKKKYEKVDRKNKLLTILGMKFIIKNKGATKTLVTVEREGESNLSPR